MTLSARPAIYYTASLPVKAGGELVNLQHVAALRQAGLRAFLLLDPAAKVQAPKQPFPVPMVHWSEQLAFLPQDWLVVPEVTPPATFEQLAAMACQVAIHNQNPYYSFKGFASIASLNRYPLAGGLCGSLSTRDTLQRWGSTTDWQVVRPYVLPTFFRAQTKQRQIAFIPLKRPADASLLVQLFRGRYPQHADLRWVPIGGMSRQQMAQVLGESLVFASLSRFEGLGLPPLEAMAAGCLVCGFDGYGGSEYASPDNGSWVADGDLEAFSEAIAGLLAMDDAAAARRVATSRATAASYSVERFNAELLRAWQHLLGQRIDQYRLPEGPAQTGDD
jgi:hypothetical protein